LIISENAKPSLEEFKELMRRMDEALNADAAAREDYYVKRQAKLLEADVCQFLADSAKGTPFEGSIQLVSGSSFPDIVAHRYFGVEVKSTEKNHWTSIGSSILESTRVAGVERIFLTFGKLGRPVRFLSRPYEECLSGIAVTHYPRYQIDMRLAPGETIFDKLGLSYDELRSMENPVAPVSRYYRQQLRPGESLWWASDRAVPDSPAEAAPMTVRLWSALDAESKSVLRVLSYALFPEILQPGNPAKYQRCALWLVTSKGIVNTNIRDQFSAGGKEDIHTAAGIFPKQSAAFVRIHRYRELILSTLLELEEDVLKEYWQAECLWDDRLLQWIHMAAKFAGGDEDFHHYFKMLAAIFDLPETRLYPAWSQGELDLGRQSIPREWPRSGG